MKSIAIVTDSNCGMSPTQVKDLGIYMLPMPFFIDDKEYLEDIDMNQSEFFQHLEQNPGCRVSTSQPTPESVTTLWDKLLKDYDEIVHIPMSSGLSSSMQTARMLAEDYDGRVRVVNNQRISGTLRYSAIEAIQQAKNGLSADEIGTWLEKNRFDSSIYITVATLKYLKQGGRITPAAAALGTMLRLKPVLQIQGEKLDAFSKARTMTQAKSTMTKAIKDDIADRFGEKINLDVIHSHNLEAAEEFRKEVLTTFPNIGEVNIFPLSLSVSCHIGPGSLALTCSKVHPEIW
ncbi:DegV family protein [Blautia massiliensis (ex Durand et al. 2017)]|uniref:DegV family EDD domain-containing protein n=1 Tax=Blautia massiliensis (ex Durand et al. 2017) TaxID=1737424 RepID=A0A6L8TGA9_9FIRM|nr:DegV family protein [Blautia massiliensis (ex Durand et al. 2017)]MZL53716.1 DegV family EDD domain-containing protein [Blautia massiliensis (ex Durand et al. 2017)]MZL63094.1 DegV family EDD domain-containing protein [Blautia massiliensis (ex Durand et al. 2017)]